MAAPNIINATTINGKTTAANLTSTSAVTILNNASGSGKCLKVNTFNVANYSGASANINVLWNNGANLGGTSYYITGNISVPANSTLNVIDKGSQIYLEENQSLGAQPNSTTAFHVTCSYEDIS